MIWKLISPERSQYDAKLGKYSLPAGATHIMYLDESGNQVIKPVGRILEETTSPDLSAVTGKNIGMAEIQSYQ